MTRIAGLPNEMVTEHLPVLTPFRAGADKEMLHIGYLQTTVCFSRRLWPQCSVCYPPSRQRPPARDASGPGPGGLPLRFSGARQGKSGHPTAGCPTSLLPGYQAGDTALPTVPITANVKDFGAQGDGTTDDTAAFHRALAATSQGALYIPPGRYRLTAPLEISEPHLVVRGAGEGHTVLEMAPPGPAGSPGRPHRARPGPGGPLTAIVQPAERGDRQLVLSSTAGLAAGQMFRLRLYDPPDNSLGCPGRRGGL